MICRTHELGIGFRRVSRQILAGADQRQVAPSEGEGYVGGMLTLHSNAWITSGEPPSSSTGRIT